MTEQSAPSSLLVAPATDAQQGLTWGSPLRGDGSRGKQRPWSSETGRPWPLEPAVCFRSRSRPRASAGRTPALRVASQPADQRDQLSG